MVEIASFLFLAGLAIISAISWQRLILSQQRQIPHPLSPRESKIAPLGFIDVLVAILIAAASQVLAAALSMQFAGISEFDLADEGHMTLINLVLGTAQFAVAGLTLLYLFNRYGDIRVTGLNPGALTQDLKLGIFGFFLFVPPMLILQSLLTNFWEYEHPTLDMITSESSLLSIVSAWWMATIVAPVSEEILFRVVLLGWLLRCFANPHDFLGGFLGGNRESETLLAGAIPVADDPEDVNPYATSASTNISRMEFKHEKTWAPVFIVALLFAVVHIGQGPAPIPIFFLALGLCYMYRQTGSVVPCIVTHFLLNAFSMTVFTIEQFYFPQEEGLTEEGLAVPAGIVDLLSSFTSCVT